MRISTAQIYNNSLSQMQNSQARLAEIQERISSGKALLRPSDDPVAASRILKLERELARTDMFTENIDASQRRLDLEELTLEQIDNAAVRVRELALQANNGTYSDADRSYMAAEVEQLQNTILALMNTKDAQGEYLFAGSVGKTEPFVQNADGSYSYQGDDGQRFIQAGPELQVASTDSGRDIFMVLEDALEVDVLGKSAALISAPEFTDEEGETFRAYSAEHGDLLVQVRKQPGATANDYTYTITDSSGAVLTGDSPASALSDIPFNTADTVEDTVSVGGVTFNLSGLSTDSLEVVQLPGGLTDSRAVSAEQVLDSATYLTFVEDFGSDLNIAMTLGSSGGEAQYSYAITDANGDALGAPYTITPAGPITEPTQITISDGATDFLTFTLTPLTDPNDPSNNLVTDDSVYTVAVTDNNTTPLVTSAGPADPTTTTYSDFVAANGNPTLVFRNNGGTLEYDLQDSGGNSVIGGYGALPADGAITDATTGLALQVDVAAVGALLTTDGDTTEANAVGQEIDLQAQVGSVLSGEAQVTLRADEGRHSLLQTMSDMVTALQTPQASFTEASDFNDIMANVILELDAAKEANLQIRTEIGGRVNSLETALEINADYKLHTETALSLLQDLDYASAVSEFSLQETALQASQATFSRVSQLSLFNYL